MTKNEHRWTQLMEQPFNFVLGKVYDYPLFEVNWSFPNITPQPLRASYSKTCTREIHKQTKCYMQTTFRYIILHTLNYVICMFKKHWTSAFDFDFWISVWSIAIYIHACIAFSFRIRIWLAKNTKPIVLKSTKSRENSKSDFNSVFMYSNLVMAQLVFL